jgi:hypothetical protein
MHLGNGYIKLVFKLVCINNIGITTIYYDNNMPLFSFLQKYNYVHKLILEDVPGEINLLFTFNYYAQQRRTSN